MRWLPPLRGVIDRRILVNFHIDPGALESILPERFRPRTVSTPTGPRAVGGICLIRLTDMRPPWVPSVVGTSSENAAHRIGVEWTADGETHTGVYVPRRDTSSRLNAVFGTAAFGQQYRATFTVEEGDGRYDVRMANEDDDVEMHVVARETDQFPEDSIFPDIQTVADYHDCGAVGYCPTPTEDEYRGIKFQTDRFTVEPLAVESVHASYFETALPDEAFEFDNALLMADQDHVWRPRESLTATA